MSSGATSGSSLLVLAATAGVAAFGSIVYSYTLRDAAAERRDAEALAARAIVSMGSPQRSLASSVLVLHGDVLVVVLLLVLMLVRDRSTAG